MKSLQFLKFSVICLIIVIMSGFGCSNESSGDYKRIGMKAFVDGHYDLARANLLKALANKPSDKDLLYFTALSYQRDYILDSAFYYIKRAYLLHPGDRELTEQLYEIAAPLGEYESAREALMKLISMGDPLEKHIEKLVNMLDYSGSITNSFYYLAVWYREYDMDELYRFRMLVSYAAKVDSFYLAWEVLDSAVTRWGDSDDFQLAKSEILFNQGDFEEVEVILRSMVEKFPDNYDFKMNLANTLCNQGSVPKMDEGLEMLKEIRLIMDNTATLDSVILSLEVQRERLLNPEKEL